MALNKISMALLLFISLIAVASPQGYMGTVTTGTGIVPPLTVGKGAISPASVGALSTQLNLTGSWSVDLKGSEIRHLDLQMFQESDLIMGSGLMLAGGANRPVTVAGSVAGDRPTIFVSTVDKPEVFRLELSASGTALAGQFDSLSSGFIRESGTVTGSMALCVPTESTNCDWQGASIRVRPQAHCWEGKPRLKMGRIHRIIS